MSIQEVREGSGKQWGSRREEKTRRNGKTKKDTPSYFLCKKEKLWFCAVTGCPTLMQERAWQYLKGMSEWRIAWGSVGASSLGSSSWEPFSMRAVIHCMHQWDNPQLAQSVLLPLTNLPEYTLSKTRLSRSQQAQWFCIYGCEISFCCWVAFFSTATDSSTGVSSRRNHHMWEWRVMA